MIYIKNNKAEYTLFYNQQKKESMKAVIISQKLHPGELIDKFEIKEVKKPTPADNEIRVKVSYSAINIDDIRIAENNFFGVKIKDTPTSKKPFTLGHDFSGTVDSVGKNTTRFKIGDKVYGQTKVGVNGSWAEYCVVSEKSLGIVSKNWKMEEAASYGTSSQVVRAVVSKLDEIQNKTILIIGVSGSIGNLALQYLVQQNANVWGVCSSRNEQIIKNLGAEKVFPYDHSPFQEQLLSEKLKVDYVIDFVGGEKTKNAAFKVLKKSGKFITAVGPADFTTDAIINSKLIIQTAWILGLNYLKSAFSRQKYAFAVMSKDSEFYEYPIGDKVIPMIDSVNEFNEEGVRKTIEKALSHRAKGKILLKII